jgi:sugar O-acyltransferase (sialic acid O-acetyltransferase NeuD family)
VSSGEDRSRLLVLWGASGHGKVVLDVGRSQGSFESIVFIDDRYREIGPSFMLCPVLGGLEMLPSLRGCSFLISIGGNAQRARCHAAAISQGLAPTTLVHQTAIIAPSAVVASGTVVMPGVIINAGAVIGENCIINTGAIVEHDCRIADHVHISPRAVLGGGVSVGPFAHVGIGAVVLPGAIIGDEALVGAGAVVLREAPAHCTVVGVPAKALLRAANSPI